MSELEIDSGFFTVLGASQDGCITRVMWMAAFGKMDSNRDGYVSRKEWWTRGGDTNLYDAIKRTFGKWRTGDISQQEWAIAFNELDVDGDSQLSRSDFRAAKANAAPEREGTPRSMRTAGRAPPTPSMSSTTSPMGNRLSSAATSGRVGQLSSTASSFRIGHLLTAGTAASGRVTLDTPVSHFLAVACEASYGSSISASGTHLQGRMGDEFSFVNRTVALIRRNLVGILSAKWLLARPSDFILQRNQDLPACAFVPPVTAASLYQREAGLVVLSYPWLTKQHPDPSGHYMRVLRQYLVKHVRQFVTSDDGDIGVFWDFAAFPQPAPDGTRTQEEKASLREGMATINFLYGSPDTQVVMLKQMPLSRDTNFNLRPYGERGWCVFEETIANILKPSLRLLDLGQPEARRRLGDENSTWWEIQRAACSKRAPILHPDAMNVKLAECHFTTGRVDRSLVQEKYQEFFVHAAGTTTNIHLSNLGEEVGDGWDDGDIELVGKALGGFVNAELVRVQRQPFSDRGLRAILEPLPTLKYLDTLSFYRCIGFRGVGFNALAGCQLPLLTTLNLSETRINDDGLIELASQFGTMPNLQTLYLRHCTCIGRSGFASLAKHLPSGLEGLHLGGSSLSDEGLVEIVHALPGLRRLSKLDIHGCENVSATGLAALVDNLPKLPRMAPAEANFKCLSGHKLVPMNHSDLVFMACTHCLKPLSGGKGFSCLMCPPYLWDICDLCVRGALLVPRHLYESPEGRALTEAWVTGGRDAVQLRWC